VSDQRGPLMHQMHAPPQEVARLTQALGIDVSRRDVAAAQQTGNLLRIEVVVLRLAAVDGLHVECVTDDKRDLLRLTQIGDPVPGEETLDAHDHVRPIRCQRLQQHLQQQLLVGGNLRAMDDVAGLVENAHRQEPGVQIDAAVESVLPCVESHHGLRVRDVRRSCGNNQHTSCEEAMMSIKALQQTAGVSSSPRLPHSRACANSPGLRAAERVTDFKKPGWASSRAVDASNPAATLTSSEMRNVGSSSARSHVRGAATWKSGSAAPHTLG
jgi:hypothetical protein